MCSPHLGLRNPEELRRFTLIHFRVGAAAAKATVPSWQAWKQRAGLDDLDAETGITFNDESSAIQAAIAGQGAALLSLALVDAELASAALIQPFWRDRNVALGLELPDGTVAERAVQRQRFGMSEDKQNFHEAGDPVMGN